MQNGALFQQNLSISLQKDMNALESLIYVGFAGGGPKLLRRGNGVTRLILLVSSAISVIDQKTYDG
ncbi:hypothetical protein shn_13865 [Shinella sp. HZN7]|nr:hypothetical protein shn_13865 [Shinella sp. HZN7]